MKNAPRMIRRLWAIEPGKVRDHLLRLDPEDRLCRFGGHVSDASIEAYCAGLDWSHAVIIGYGPRSTRPTAIVAR